MLPTFLFWPASLQVMASILDLQSGLLERETEVGPVSRRCRGMGRRQGIFAT